MGNLVLSDVQKAYMTGLPKDQQAKFVKRLEEQAKQAEAIKAEKAKAKVKAPGVIDTIEAIVRSCKTEKSALNETQIADKLAKVFPERKLKGMLKTVHTQLTSGLKSKGFSRMEEERSMMINISIRQGKRYFWVG